MSRVFAIVAAAGGGTRFGAHLAKQYVAIGDKPMLVHSIERLQRAVAPARTLVALGVEDHEYEARISRLPDVDAVRCGGVTRAATVRNALDRLAPQSEADDWILVHDAARPCVPRETLSRLVRELADDPVGGLLAIPVTDTLKRADDDPAARRVIALGLERENCCGKGKILRVRHLDVLRAAHDEARAPAAAAGREGLNRLRLVGRVE